MPPYSFIEEWKMSDVKNSKRKKSRLEAQHMAYAIRKRIMAELMASFALSQKRIEAYVESATKGIADISEREVTAKLLRELTMDRNVWFITKERDTVLDLCQGISRQLRMGNTVFPEYYSEFIERRLQLDRAMEYCNALQDELQFIAETIPCDKNKYMNTASQKGKGVAMFRRQLENDLRRYYRVHGTNKGCILLTDFSGYYPNMNHDICKKQLSEFLDKSKLDAETITTAKFIIDGLFKTFETDVSRFSDDEIEKMYYTKIDPMMNCGVDPKLLTGEKMLRKGVDIGTQPSQDIGIIHPYKIDNCAKIVFSIEGYGRYTDDIRAISESKERLENLLEAIKKLADEIGLILNMRKTRIARIDKPFRILQIQYWLTDTGRVVKKINPKSVTRERKKLKAYKRQLDLGKIDFATVENSFKSWIASNYKIMSRLQIDNMFKLYYSLFGRRITWKKKHSRLRWLMEQALKDLPKTETTS